MRKDLNSGTNIIDATKRKQKYLHLEPVTLSEHSFADVKMLLGQDGFHFVHPLDLFESDHQNTSVAVHLPFGWVMTGPLLSTSGLVFTCFNAFERTVDGSDLAEQLCKWYELDSHGASRQVNPRAAADARALRILEHSNYIDGYRYHVGMFWADDDSNLPEN